MPTCSICAWAFEDSEQVQRHERRKHRDAHFANLEPGQMHYKAPSSVLPFCALCNIYIGFEATYDHLSNPRHIELSKSAAVETPVSKAAPAETPTLDDDLLRPSILPRRPRAKEPSSPPNEDEHGTNDDTPLQVPPWSFAMKLQMPHCNKLHVASTLVGCRRCQRWICRRPRCNSGY
jgi:hypothetical protein